TCNGLLKFGPDISELSENEKRVKLAEAHFLRAFYYSQLIAYFGDVTLNTDFFETPTTAAERHPQAVVYDVIIQDLQKAMEDLPASPKSTGTSPGRASAAAAQHLLAKVLLNRAYSADAQTNDFQQA